MAGGLQGNLDYLSGINIYLQERKMKNQHLKIIHYRRFRSILFVCKAENGKWIDHSLASICSESLILNSPEGLWTCNRYLFDPIDQFKSSCPRFN